MTRLWWHRVARFVRRVWRWLRNRVPERLWILWVCLRLIFSRSFSAARYAVRKVATDTSLYAEFADDPRGALERRIARQATLYPGAGENLLRMGEAREWAEHWLRHHGRRAGRVELNGLVELAYLAYRSRG